MARLQIKKENRNVRRLIIWLAIILAFLGVVNPDIRSAVFINLMFLGISFLVYRAPEYQDTLIGLNGKNTLESIGWGIAFTFVFFLATLFIPGLSLGYPVLPGDISASLEWFMIVIISPLTESIFFLGAVLAFFREMTPKKKALAITLASLLFASFHLGAYILGFYQYPNFATGLTAIWANISAFMVAFLFNMVAGFWITKKGVKNQVFAFVFHFGLNLIAFSLSVVTFAFTLSLLF